MQKLGTRQETRLD